MFSTRLFTQLVVSPALSFIQPNIVFFLLQRNGSINGVKKLRENQMGRKRRKKKKRKRKAGDPFHMFKISRALSAEIIGQEKRIHISPGIRFLF